MLLDLPVLKKGDFYFIKDSGSEFVLEDKTKRGLTIKETSIDECLKINADKGIIYDMDGTGNIVVIRWYFPKNQFTISDVLIPAEAMEKKYTELRELTCPDDD
jgi:hypothetical protein